MEGEANDEAVRKLRGGVHLRTTEGADLQQEMRKRIGMVTSEISRADQLHILGNGVVPQEAAYALTVLAWEMNGGTK